MLYTLFYVILYYYFFYNLLLLSYCCVLGLGAGSQRIIGLILNVSSMGTR